MYVIRAVATLTVYAVRVDGNAALKDSYAAREKRFAALNIPNVTYVSINAIQSTSEEITAIHGI